MREIPLNEKDIRSSREFLARYLQNLDTFFRHISPEKIPDFYNGYAYCRRMLNKAILLSQKSFIERSSISRHMLKKFHKIFLYGLNRIVNGLRAVFDPEIIKKSGISREQMIRYMIDSKEGLGNKYQFNTVGNYTFMNKIWGTNPQELRVIFRFLRRPSQNQIRSYNGWVDIGINGAQVRILAVRKRIGKDRVYFIFRNNLNEKREYQRILQSDPETFQFIP